MVGFWGGFWFGKKNKNVVFVVFWWVFWFSFFITKNGGFLGLKEVFDGCFRGVGDLMAFRFLAGVFGVALIGISGYSLFLDSFVAFNVFSAGCFECFM